MSLSMSTKPEKSLNTIKITVLGDACVGKTCMISTYKNKSFPKGFVGPTVWEVHETTFSINGQEHLLSIWEYTGCDGYERIREEEAIELKTKIKARAFVQCSALTGDGVDQVFIETVRAVITPSKDKNCYLL